MFLIPDLLIFVILSSFLYVLPGWALLSLLGNDSCLDFPEKLCLSAGLSVSLYALFFHLFYQLKLAPGSAIAWIPGMTAAVCLAAAFTHRRFFRKHPPLDQTTKDPVKKTHHHTDSLFTAMFMLVTVLLVVSRFVAIRGMAVPSWGDSVHHTLIVQLLREHGGLFQSWDPYTPIASMTYHFGFHAAAVVWAWVAGISSHFAVLQVGQVFGILAVLALYPLTTRISGNRWVGLAVVILAGFLSPIPGHYANWGRYPQLAGLIVGLTALWAISSLSRGRFSFWSWGGKRFILLLVLFTGMWLSHYRLSFIILAAAAVWAADAMWQLRKDLKDWLWRVLVLGASGAAAALVLLPWVKISMSNRLLNVVMGSQGAEVKQLAVRTDIGLWKNLDFYYPRIFLILALVCLIPALKLTPRLTRLVLFSAGLAFLVANPHLVGFSWGLGWLRNENLVMVFFILFSILIGSVLGSLWKKLRSKPLGSGVLVMSTVLLLLVGARIQFRIIDPFFQMVKPSDIAAFRWIRLNTTESAHILVNGFVIGKGNMAYGSDAGWWLPYFTHRSNTLLPAIGNMERLEPGVDKANFARIVREVRDSEGDPEKLREVLRREKITYVFMGAKRGAVGYETLEMIPETWLRHNPNFTLLFEEGKSQVWRFNAPSLPLCKFQLPGLH